jgi:hypothetical protein
LYAEVLDPLVCVHVVVLLLLGHAMGP